MKNTIFIIIILFTIVSGQNNVSKVGTTAGEVLSMPAGARGLALGNAVAGLDGDGSVFFWNPAAAADIDRTMITASYLPWLVDTKFQYFSCVFSVRPGLVFGGSAAAWSMGDMPVRTEIDQDGTGQFFDAGDLVLTISAAHKMTDRFSVGINLKYLQERIWHSVARGFAVDFGTIYKTDILNGMKIITTLNNYGTDMTLDGRDLDILYDPLPDGDGNNGEIPANYNTDPWALPLNFRFGLASDILRTEKLKIAVEIDALHPSNNFESIDAGIEISFMNIIFFRTGYSSVWQTDSIEGISVGGGLVIPFESGSVIFDYGYREFGDLGYIQAMTLGINF